MLMGVFSIDVELEESDEVLLELSVVLTVSVVVESVELVELLLPSLLLVVEETGGSMTTVPGSGEGDGVEVPAEIDRVASVADAWRTAPVPPARAQTEMATPMAARVEITARSRD